VSVGGLLRNGGRLSSSSSSSFRIDRLTPGLRPPPPSRDVALLNNMHHDARVTASHGLLAEVKIMEARKCKAEIEIMYHNDDGASLSDVVMHKLLRHDFI